MFLFFQEKPFVPLGISVMNRRFLTICTQKEGEKIGYNLLKLFYIEFFHVKLKHYSDVIQTFLVHQHLPLKLSRSMNSKGNCSNSNTKEKNDSAFLNFTFLQITIN